MNEAWRLLETTLMVVEQLSNIDDHESERGDPWEIWAFRPSKSAQTLRARLM